MTDCLGGKLVDGEFDLDKPSECLQEGSVGQDGIEIRGGYSTQLQRPEIRPKEGRAIATVVASFATPEKRKTCAKGFERSQKLARVCQEHRNLAPGEQNGN